MAGLLDFLNQRGGGLLGYDDETFTPSAFLPRAYGVGLPQWFAGAQFMPGMSAGFDMSSARRTVEPQASEPQQQPAPSNGQPGGGGGLFVPQLDGDNNPIPGAIFGGPSSGGLRGGAGPYSAPQIPPAALPQVGGGSPGAPSTSVPAAPPGGGFLSGVSDRLAEYGPALTAGGAALLSGEGIGGTLGAMGRTLGALTGFGGGVNPETSRGPAGQIYRLMLDRGLDPALAKALASQRETALAWLQNHGVKDQTRPLTAQEKQKFGLPEGPWIVGTDGTPKLPEGFAGLKPQFTQIGEDSLGRKQYGFVDQHAQRVMPAQIPGAGATSAADNPQGLTGEAYLKSIDPSMANTVRGILEGRMQPPTSFAASKPYWQGVLQHAANAEPGFDLTKWQARVGAAKDFASGKAAQNVTALNTVVGHLGDLMDAADALNNRGFTWWNAATNFAANATGDPAVRRFEIARNAVADEMAKVFRSSGMSDTEIHAWKSTLDTSSSPQQFRAVIKQGIGLMESRLEALRDQYQRGYGKEAPDLLSPKSRATLDKLERWYNGQAAAAPSAPPPNLANMTPEQQMQLAPEGSRGIVRGVPSVKRNGQWVPQ